MVYNNLLLFNIQIVIPTLLRKDVMERIHHLLFGGWAQTNKWEKWYKIAKCVQSDNSKEAATDLHPSTWLSL